jgi:hypothetical protein
LFGGRYSASMKILPVAVLMVAFPILSTAAGAQCSDKSTERRPPRVTKAHCQYTPNDPACRNPRERSVADRHCQHPAPCQFWCCFHGYPPPSGRPWILDPENNSHATAGALIGLGLGGALGASKDGNADSRLAGALVIGGLGALIGSVIGHGIPNRHWHRRRPDWDDPDENAGTREKPAMSPALAFEGHGATEQPLGP